MVDMSEVIPFAEFVEARVKDTPARFVEVYITALYPKLL